ncbi:FAD-binding oxidoreductase [Devosia limi]|nr:FAD-binding oxidoreductase [Devosia limi]SHF59901.1 alkyldihydroxyacetonephosphate synthase [Devosia limi DSM 17137]
MTHTPIAIPSRAPTPIPGAVGLGHAPVLETLDGQAVAVDAAFIRSLEGVCTEVSTDSDDLVEWSRDWWPLGMVWAMSGRVARLPAVVVRPHSIEEVSAVMRLAHEARIPVTVAGGRSGVLGNSLPVFGGVVLDLTKLSGITDLRVDDLTVDVLAGTFGDTFEAALQAHGHTAGHWPQSIALSTIGGWIACSGAGQMSTRYGTMADITRGVTAVLADGRVIETSEYSHSATGPDMTQLFVGSEGTLGVIVSARLNIHKCAPYRESAAWAFDSFAAGVEAIKRFSHRGARPAVVRLYDATEARRNFDTSDQHILLVHDEGDPAIVAGIMAVVRSECDGQSMGTELVDRWLANRNSVHALDDLIVDRAPDTMEITAPWSQVSKIYRETTAAMAAVQGTRTATAHISHAYPGGAGLYFMFGGRPELEDRPRWYREVWNAGARTVLANGGNLSHHHGVGLGRARFMREAMGTGLDVLADVKRGLDPHGILNPGKLGLDSPFGPTPQWQDKAPSRK